MSILIGRGAENIIRSDAQDAFIGGGYHNANSAPYAVIGGGAFNSIQTNSLNARVGGGYLNVTQDGAQLGAIAGGGLNTIETNALYSGLVSLFRWKAVLSLFHENE